MAATKKCPKCTRDMVALTLTVDGDDRVLRSCSHCDLRQWEMSGGTQTSLAGVLQELTASQD